MFWKKKKVIPEEKRQAIFAKVRPIIAKQLGIKEEQILPRSQFNRDLGIDFDSLAAIELVMALEEKLNIEIPDSDADKIKTVDDIVAFLSEK